LLVLVTGAAPGLGKSQLASSLDTSLAERGLDVALFEEQKILEQDVFAYVIQEWHANGSVSDETLLAGASAYLDWCCGQPASVFILDALLPYLPSLLAWAVRILRLAASLLGSPG
jgi:hypothetical protein